MRPRLARGLGKKNAKKKNVCFRLKEAGASNRDIVDKLVSHSIELGVCFRV